MINYSHKLLKDVESTEINEIIDFTLNSSYGYNRTVEDNLNYEITVNTLNDYFTRENSYLVTAYDDDILVGCSFFLDSSSSPGINLSSSSNIIKNYMIDNNINQNECFSITYIRVHKDYQNFKICKELMDYSTQVVALENGFKNILIFSLVSESTLSFYQNYFGEKLVVTDVIDPGNIIDEVITENLMIVRDV